MKQLLFSLLVLLTYAPGHASPLEHNVKGRVIDENGLPLAGATIRIDSTNTGTSSDAEGYFYLPELSGDIRSITVSFIGYAPIIQPIRHTNRHDRERIIVQLHPDMKTLDQVEVFGSRYKQPEKLDDITRMPLRPGEQIQSISVISDKLIGQQGNLTLADATRNVVGISTFATYGNVSESLSARGFRGLPTLKNGVRVHSDFRGQGFLTDMQGVESIQVIKGTAAITQGVGTDLGSAGGVVNIATKTPKFVTSGEIALRAGSWGQFRPTFDIQSPLTRKGDLAVRFNGAYERGKSYRDHVSKDRIYVNPSVAWRPNDKTTLIAEMDYLHDSRTPDRGTVNLAADSVNALYDMPGGKFLGFASDRVYTNTLSWSLRMNRRINNHLSLRVAYMQSGLETDNTGAATKTLKNVAKTGEYNILARSLGRSRRDDENQVLQIDLIGQDLFTGSIKHTFQTGIDYKRSAVSSTSYQSVLVDTIDVLKSIVNTLPADITLIAGDPSSSTAYSYGIMAQDVITFNQYIKAVLGIRYSYGNSYTGTSSATTSGDAWNPLAGLIISPVKNIHLFGSYTNTTDLRSAANLMEDGSPVGESTTEQFEAGIKSDWFNNHLRFNITYFHMLNSNLAYLIYDENWQSTERYAKAGDLLRRGIEAEITGRLLPNLQVILGYAYLDAQYKDSPAYYEGSAPMNAPRHTANGWIYYNVEKGLLSGLSLGAGAYYVGKRPVNEYTKKATHTNTSPNMKPFDMDAYTTVNARIGYDYKKFGLNVFFNNIFNSTGYSSYYRGGYINPTDPFNMAANLTYRF